MKLIKARVQNYRSVRDTGEFEVEALKTILVGPNEAGKSAILQALQQINRPEGVNGFERIGYHIARLLQKPTFRSFPANGPLLRETPKSLKHPSILS